MSNLRPVSRAEQEKMGLVRVQRPANYVPELPARRAPELPAQASTTYTIDAAPSAQLGSITHTNAVDRAKGYLIVQLPLAAIVAVLVLAVAKSLADFPLISLAAFLVFWISFAAVWLVGWFVTLLLSAEGVAFFEAKRKWDVVEREQDERWAHYNRQIETQAPPPMQPDRQPAHLFDGIDWPVVLYAAGALWAMVLITWLVVGR